MSHVTHICTHAYKIHVYIQTHTRVYVYIHTYKHTCTHTHTHALYANIHINIYEYIHTYTHTRIYVCIHTHTYTYTYTHTNTSYAGIHMYTYSNISKYIYICFSSMYTSIHDTSGHALYAYIHINYTNVSKNIYICCSFIYTCIYAYIHIYTCRMHTWEHIHVYVYTHTHSYNPCKMSHAIHLSESSGTHERVYIYFVYLRKRATNYRALLRKMTYEDKASYGILPPCIHIYIYE